MRVLCASCVDSCAPVNAEFLKGDKQKVVWNIVNFLLDKFVLRPNLHILLVRVALLPRTEKSIRDFEKSLLNFWRWRKFQLSNWQKQAFRSKARMSLNKRVFAENSKLKSVAPSMRLILNAHTFFRSMIKIHPCIFIICRLPCFTVNLRFRASMRARLTRSF